MCQKLVDRVAQSKQLMAVADPELLVLFEDWLDELEQEVIAFFTPHRPVNPRPWRIISGCRSEGRLF